MLEKTPTTNTTYFNYFCQVVVIENTPYQISSSVSLTTHYKVTPSHDYPIATITTPEESSTD